LIAFALPFVLVGLGICWAGAFLWHGKGIARLIPVAFGLIFVVVGMTAIWQGVRRRSWRDDATEVAIRQAEKGRGRRRWGPAMLFLIFAVAGAAGVWFLFLKPWQQGRRAMASWQHVPCSIISSGVSQSSSSRRGSSPSYTFVVLYRYRVGNRVYESHRYKFLSESGAESDAAAVAARYPRGRTTTCLVDPADPTSAVLDASAGSLVWLMIPGVFFLIGLIGLLATLGGGLRALVRQGTGFGPDPGLNPSGPVAAVPAPNTSAVTLRPQQGPMTIFLWICAAAILFSGILAGNVIWGSGLGCATVVFVPICAGLIWGAVYFGRGLSNPRVEVTLAPGTIPPGGSAELRWQFTGPAERVRRLTISLEGRELTTIQGNKNSSHPAHAFSRIALVDEGAIERIATGHCRVTIPPGAMHTFRGGNNQVEWMLWVDGQIAGRPNVRTAFTLDVPPPPPRPHPRAANAEPVAPMKGEIGIQLAGGRTSFAPGEIISGIASWDLPERPGRIEVQLLWYTRGKGDPDVQIVDRATVDDPAPLDHLAFTFHAPAGPLSYTGTLFSLAWALEVRQVSGGQPQRVELILSSGEEPPGPSAAASSPQLPA
jgi:hypothetical protein